MEYTYLLVYGYISYTLYVPIPSYAAPLYYAASAPVGEFCPQLTLHRLPRIAFTVWLGECGWLTTFSHL